MKKFLRIAWKILWRTLVALLLLVILLFVALKLPITQRFIADKAENFLEEKTNTAVNIGQLNINFPKSVSIENLFVEDANRDTLLNVGEISVLLSLSDLMEKKITVTEFDLVDTYARVIRKDSTFNFHHFITAFSDTSATSEAEVDTAASPSWTFGIEDISLKNIRARYYDLDKGDSTDAFVGSFNTSFETFDLQNQQFYLSEILLEYTTAQVAMHSKSAETEEQEESASIPDIRFENVQLNSIAADYQNYAERQHFRVDLNSFLLVPESFDLNKKEIKLDQIELGKALLYAELYSPTDTSSTQKSDSTSSKFPLDIPWKLSLADIDLTEVNLEYHNSAVPDTSKAFDANHLKIDGLDLGAEDLAMIDGELNANLKSLSFATAENFALNNLSTQVLFNNETLEVSNLLVETSRSSINGHAVLSYRDFNEFTSDLESGTFHVDLKSQKLSVEDIAYWVPAVADSIFNPQNPSFSFGINAEGSVKKTLLNQLTVGVGDQTTINASGFAENLLDPGLLSFDLGLEHELYAADLKQFLHPSLLPASLELPAKTSGTYDLVGSINNFDTELDVSSSLGEIFGTFHLENLTADSSPKYDVALTAENLDLQTFTKGDSTGAGLCTFELEANGSGFAPAEMDNEFSLKLHQITYNRYDYREFNLTGGINKGILKSSGGIRDTNIIVSLENTLNLENIYDANVEVNVEGADLQRLNFAEEDVRLKGKVKVNSIGTGLTDLNASVDLRNALIIKEGDRYYLDSLVVKTELAENKTDFQINSDILNGWLKGNLPPDEIALSIQQQVNNYVELFEIETDTLAQNPHFSFSFSLNQTDLISEVILPELKSFEVGKIEGEFNEPEVGLVNMSIKMPQVKYADFSIDSLSFNMSGDRDSLIGTFGFDKLDYDTLTIHKTALNTKVSKGNAHVELAILDTAETREYTIGANINRLADTISISLDNELLLHYASWQAKENNAILISDQLNFRNFEISRNGMSLNVKDEEGTLELNANNFSLAAISGMLSGEIVPLSGKLDGTLTSNPQSRLSANMTISDIQVFEKPLGTLDVSMENEAADEYELDLRLSGNGNDVRSAGKFTFADSTSAIDLTTDINQIALKSFTPFTTGYLSDMKGNLRGKVDLRGSLDQPEVSGNINFDQVWLKVDYLNAYFNLQNEKIDIRTDGFRFPDFTVRDSTGNKAQLNGSVLTENYVDYNFDLSVTTNDYKLISTTKESSEFYYGTVILDSDISVKGPMTNLDVTANVNLEKGTVFNMLIPQTDVAARDREGIVEFIDPDASIEENILTRTKSSSANTADFTNLNFNSTITVDKETVVNIIIDPVTGDKLTVQGGATLSLGINPGGNINLVGNYVIQDGKYQMKAFGVMRREFDIKEGSSLEWSGDPLEAQMNITAIYQTRTSPYNLVAPYISSTGSNAELQQLKGQLPFRVYLMMEGALMSPNINFDIELPEGQRNAMGGRVYARLNQLRENESALNKQVFALLVLNSFIAEDPTAGANDGSNPASSAARKSVSRFLSDQLNRLSDKYIQGVDISVDVESYEDYSAQGSSGQTDVSLNVSKSLMDDRLILRVGSSIAVEGEAAQQQNASDITGDLVLEYKITEDGRYRFKAFRVNSYENLAVGQVTETGAGIIFTQDYNEFRELFRKPDEDQNKVETEK